MCRKARTFKSRCCTRGFLDRQKKYLNEHSSIASRFSHRLACSLGVQNCLELNSFDIKTAFLQGLKYSELGKKAKELGFEVKLDRKVWFVPPANVWRHLRNIPNSGIWANDWQIGFLMLELVKAIYGLVEGPTMFQLALLHYLTQSMGLYKSVHDNNFLTMTEGWNIVVIV